LKTSAIFPSCNGKKLERFNNRVDASNIQGITTTGLNVKELYAGNTLVLLFVVINYYLIRESSI